MMDKKIFKCNEDGVAEWCIAESKTQAYTFMRSEWGDSTMDEYLNEYLTDNQDNNEEDFIDEFFTEVNEDKNFTMYECGEKGNEVISKTYREWLDECDIVPSYFACAEW